MSGTMVQEAVRDASPAQAPEGPVPAGPDRNPLRWELALAPGAPVPANVPGTFARTGEAGGLHVWTLLPDAPSDRPGYDPGLEPPAFVVDNLGDPTPPFRAGETDGPTRIRFRIDADGDLVRVLREPWDPASDPIPAQPHP